MSGEPVAADAPTPSPTDAVAALSVDELTALAAEHGYLVDEGLATAIYLAVKLRRPLLLEGAPGVGKTEAAKFLATITARDLTRLQCYEGIDSGQAIYEWDHVAQLLHARVAATAGADVVVEDVYAERFLRERPLLRSVRRADSTLLLIDEIDRADVEFEALLLEFLSDFQVSIPELGTVRASEPPLVVLTSNRTRELAGALRRRCLYHWIDFPDAAREQAIVRTRAPELDERAAAAIVAAVRRARDRPLLRPPGIAETIEWARGAAVLTRRGTPWPEALTAALGLLVKDRDDLALLKADAARAAASVTGDDEPGERP